MRLKVGRIFIAAACALIVFLTMSACGSVGKTEVASKGAAVEEAAQHSWTRVTEAAAFPGAYNFPVFNMRGQMWAFHPQGNWYSDDAKTWTKSELPLSGLNSGYQKYVQFKDAVYALGTMEGNYTNMRLHSRIARTTDFKRWETLAETSELPARVFYGAQVFDGKIWLMGGFDGKDYYNDVWNSGDGVHWTRVAAKSAWSPRNVGMSVVFKDKIWIIGGGLIDGTPGADKQAEKEIWSSGDGINWMRATGGIARAWGGTPIVFDGKLWLVGANRDGTFTRAVLVTDDLVNWREETAPWSPRGAAATWVFDNKLYMTGGKYSVTENGEIKFIYSNDVWYLTVSRT
ncbi:MAG: hypothetical protein ABR577_18195 [Pyrinomonadaceae bacterium]